jgi:hypothetical protein
MSQIITKDDQFKETPPPAPMSIFDQRVVHDDNRAILHALQQRLERFKPLPKQKYNRLLNEAKRLSRRLKREGVFDQIALLNLYHDEYVKLADEYRSLRIQAGEYQDVSLMPVELIARGREIKRMGAILRERFTAVELRLAKHEAKYDRFIRIKDRLTEHHEVMKRLREESKLSRQFFKEGKLIEKLLIEAFRMTDGCYVERFNRKGKRIRITPKFQEIWLSSTVHSYVLLTSKKTLFGWKNKLRVNIENLIDPNTTLRNMSAILHRQVWVDWDRTGSLPIFKINRLDIKDGLPTHTVFEKIIDIYPVGDHESVPIPVGLGENFRAHWLNLERTPHILIAGSTGTGKSNFANVILCTLLSMQSPDEVRILAIDNKDGVEFNRYRNVPHLVDNIVDTTDNVLPALKSAIRMMHNRLRKLKDHDVLSIIEYNRIAKMKMPRLIIFIDEMSTLLNRPDTSEIHHAMTLITQLGRAAGIHMIAATQYPKSETLPTEIKGNMAGIVGFRMTNFAGSNMLFNSDDAYRLARVKGRAFIDDAGERYKAQTPFISRAAVDRAIRFSISQYQFGGFVELQTDTQEYSPIKALNIDPRHGAILLAIHMNSGKAKALNIVQNTSISQAAVYRHLDKLIELQYVTKSNSEFCITDTGVDALVESNYIEQNENEGAET